MFAKCNSNAGSIEAHILSNDIMRWHSRLRHFNCKTLTMFAKSNNVVGLNKIKGEVKTCEACYFSNAKKKVSVEKVIFRLPIFWNFCV